MHHYSRAYLAFACAFAHQHHNQHFHRRTVHNAVPPPLALLVAFSLGLTGTLATDAAGTAFLKEKAAEAGVTATGSGLLYKVIKSADSPAKSPLVSTPTVCHYKGTLIDGTE